MKNRDVVAEILAKKRRLRRRGRDRSYASRFFTAHDRIVRINNGVELLHASPDDHSEARKKSS